MSSSSVANSMAVQIPECGCNKPMRMYISNSGENPKRRYWKCPTHGGVQSCNLFVWDDEIEGHPPYVRPTARPNARPNVRSSVRQSELGPRNFLDYKDSERNYGTNSCGCNCSELFQDVASILKENQFNKGEKMKMKLHNERKTSKMFKNLLFCSWIIFFVYVIMLT
ncbi:unnamed protein product [Trifolium pratense]|uniref:Uncharacterized protein n=1 Tax=Trifolium pratense TaxID=57577 RepID=A0ACB0MEW8_TRIPR|nr:unnamed protein product [Trifolium pratense]